jgi:hypothetical protein
MHHNIWHNIPLADYENHMSHGTVHQAQFLSGLTQKYLLRFEPEYPLFLGISGGNGLEHIDAGKTKKVRAVDINSTYLEKIKERYSASLPQLELICADINTSALSSLQTDFIWGALIFEYLDMHKGFDFIARNKVPSARVIITIQLDNGIHAVSQTGIESIKQVEQLFKFVNETELLTSAKQFNLRLEASEENPLPGGKVFKTFVLQ